MKLNRRRYKIVVLLFIIIGCFYSLNADLSSYTPEVPEITIIEETTDTTQDIVIEDTARNRFPVSQVIPDTYDELEKNYPIDLRTPRNLEGDFQFNPVTNRYELRSKIGGADINTPISLTREEYLRYTMQRSMGAYYHSRYAEEVARGDSASNDILSMFDFNFDLGPAEKLFGPGGVKLNAQGSAEIKMGVTNTKTGNPTLSERQRNRTTFDFDTQVQTAISASVGDKINFDLNYNTESTFDFDTKKLKLGYTGKEDEIIKVLEAGNVSMNTTNSLIRGGTSLFGIKTELQFGKLTVGAVVSQQESQARTTSSKGNKQTVSYNITVDSYDYNTHFFLSHYFYDNYDNAMSALPYIKSGISIDKVEIWVTNKRANYDEARNIVAFADLGEVGDNISNPAFVQTNTSAVIDNIPHNRTNNLYTNLIDNYPGVRSMSNVSQVLNGTPLEGGIDYEKIENARKLSSSEYSLNSQLGYISLSSEIQADEVLAIAYSYTYRGVAYQVGEFSTDNTENTGENLYVKLLKNTSTSPALPSWRLMMKNFYTINNGGITNDDFRLNIQYQDDTTGVYMNYLTEGKIENKTLLSVMKLDRLNSRQEAYSDGFFDYVEGYTAFSQRGKIAFPVIEPFGKHLQKAIDDNAIAEKYIFTELYDSTLTIAKQTAEKNKFVLSGQYKGSNNTSISSGSGNITSGSVVVTANGVLLKENIDYIVDYGSGDVTIINPSYENANIQVSSEDNNNFSMQRKTMMGVNLNYAFNPKFNVGATLMNLSEMPTTMKVNPGYESVNNTLYGFNLNYAGQSQALTNLLDKLPLLELTAPSQISLTAEYAQLIPGHYKNEYGGDFSYIDDFESAKITYDLRSPYTWMLSSTPSMFAESGAQYTNNIKYGNNRAMIAWYYIDGLFTRKSSLTPNHIKNDLDQLSNHYVREVLETELYPNKDVRLSESSSIPILNIAYYPNERGPYNLDADNINSDGTLQYPESRWGGIMRKIDSGQTDFETQNIETIEFWLLDPFIYKPNADGGDLYLNLGEVSEDILKDGKKFFENGIPITGDISNMDTTAWGLVPRQQSLTYAFDNSEGSRRIQDVGLNGLSTDQEKTFPTYVEYLEKLRQKLSPETIARMNEDQFSPFNDPAGDNYHYYRGSDYDNAQTSILDRYKRYNGTEGNSADSKDSPESYNTAAKSTPDVEDINQDNTLSDSEKFFRYRISIRPEDLQVGKNYIAQKMETKPTLKNGESETVTWYQFKVPVSEFESKVGGITDFKSIRFMRLFMTGFNDTTVLRFGTFELVRGDWREYTNDLSNPNMPPATNATMTVSTVNIEESGEKQPVNYIMPPGVNRVVDPGQTQLLQQNEQSLSLTIENLAAGDARAIYKTSGMDARQYRRLQMFIHAEQLKTDLTNLQDNDLSVFIRLGSDYRNNYYEYEVPLKITPPGRYQSTTTGRNDVWPEDNMIDFPFELLTDLKLERNKEKRKNNSDVTYYTPYSTFDPDKPLNKVTVTGNPTLSEIKVIMIGVRNNASQVKSTEVWVNELRLTEFNEDGGWAANVNLFVGMSDFGTLNFVGKKETAGFGSLDAGIADRNIDDMHEYNITTQFELGKFFPEKAKVSLPLYYSYREEVVSPKYDPLDQDVLLKDALDAVETKAERDSIKSYSIDKVTTKTISFNNIGVGIQSQTPMPYDPANFSMAVSHTEENTKNATTEYEKETKSYLNLGYNYSNPLKPWQPFKKNTGASNTRSAGASSSNRAAGTQTKTNHFQKFFDEISIGYLPKSISLSSEMSRDYYELQLRDVSNLGGPNMIPVSFREDFYWNRMATVQWDFTNNLRTTFTTNTYASIDTPHEQVSKKHNSDGYELWKDSVIRSIRNWGTPMEYHQTFNATYAIPFKNIPILNFITANAKFNATYDWEKGALIASGDEDAGDEIEYINMGNTIRNSRIIGLDNVSFNLETLYNKSEFLKKANEKYTFKRPQSNNTSSRANNRRNANNQNQRNQNNQQAREAENKKRFETEIALDPEKPTIVEHKLNNKRVKVTARGSNGKIYELKYKKMDANSIRINTKDTANIKIVVNQLPPLEDERWYKIAQGASRFLMMVRSAGFSYSQTHKSMIPNFSPGIGDFTGQGDTPMGSAPGFDFAFGLTGQGYIQKALNNEWLIKSEDNITPAVFNKAETFTMTAMLEPITGLQITLNGARTKNDQSQIYFMYDDQTQKLNGDFQMTTIALASAFERPSSKNGYSSKAFDKFLANRATIARRLESQYNNVQYPNSGFLAGSGLAGTDYDPGYGNVNQNSSDVLVAAFLAAYTGKDAGSMNTSAFPSLRSLLPNWKATYTGLLQIPAINKLFKAFSLEHGYSCLYSVGAYNSNLSWVSAGSDNIGFVQSATTDYPIPSSPYDITSVSISEKMQPLIGLNTSLHNNASFKLHYNTGHSVNLNITSYQIVEVISNEFVVGAGYKFENFNEILKIRRTGGRNFNNELNVSADVSYKKLQNLIRKIEDNYTQPQSGDTQVTLKMSADYSLSRMLTLQAYFDKSISNPLVSSSAYPLSKTNFGISCRISLSR